MKKAITALVAVAALGATAAIALPATASAAQPRCRPLNDGYGVTALQLQGASCAVAHTAQRWWEKNWGGNPMYDNPVRFGGHSWWVRRWARSTRTAAFSPRRLLGLTTTTR